MPTYNDLRPDKDLQKQGYALVFPSMTKTEKKRTQKRARNVRLVPRACAAAQALHIERLCIQENLAWVLTKPAVRL